MIRLFPLLAMIAAGPQSVVILKPVANMYSSATERSDVVSQAIYATPVTILEEKPGWAKIQTPDQYAGWVPEAALGRGIGPREGRAARVVSLFANLYEEPDVTKHQPVLVVPFETSLDIVPDEKQTERWLKTRLVGGGAAWVQRGDISFDDAPLPIPNVIELGKRFLGLPYLWGGTSSFGYDCSGFTQMLCRRRGVMIPRDASPQARWEGMAPVEKKDLVPGDLVYFGSSIEKISHTGMYIGDGRFIHATTHQNPVVQISSLDEPHWTKLYVCARRIRK